jgi:hypothetical protein
MIDQEAEVLLRETFLDRERTVSAVDPSLMDSVRRSARRRRLATLSGTAVAIVAVVALAGGVVGAVVRGGPAESPPAAAPVPSGWITFTGFGMEIAAPPDWTLQSFACGELSKAPGVMLRNSIEATCMVHEPPGKPVAFLRDGASREYGFPVVPVTLSGVPADRSEGVLPDGRYGGEIVVASRHVSLIVRTPDPAVTNAILDSARLIDVDRNGCPTSRPAGQRPGSAMVPERPVSANACYYPREAVSISTPLREPLRSELIAALNGPPRPDPYTCGGSVRPNLLLQFGDGGGSTIRIWVDTARCTVRHGTTGMTYVDGDLLDRVRGALEPSR